MAVAAEKEFDSDESTCSGTSDNEVIQNEEPPAPKRAKKGLRKGVRAGEEMRTLSDFETNVVILQINDILKDVSVKEKRRQSAISWFNQLREVLLNARVTRKHAQSIQTPLRPLPEDAQLADFKFHPPKSVTLVGSFAYETAMKWSAIDIAVEIPSECFVKWDYHNMKYHRKRALYLTYLAAALQKTSSLHSRLHWRVEGDDRLPVLVVTSPNSNFTAHILPYPESGLFQSSRFGPDKFNIQEKFYSQPANSRKPVPIYNGGVLQDMLMVANKDILSNQLSTSNGIRGGIQILKLWLRSRGLSSGPDGFTSFHLTAYVQRLLQSGRLNSIMAVYQVVRAVLAQIQTEDWISDRLLPVPPENGVKETHKLMVAQGAKGILIDDSHNIFYRLSATTLNSLRTEALAALHTLNSASVTLINELLTTSTSFYRKFDYYAQIELSQRDKSEENVDAWTRANFGSSVLWPTSRSVMDTLRQAFGRRVSLLSLQPLPHLEWELRGEMPDEVTRLEVGWSLNPDEVHHIEKGPPADSPEAGKFREFWGEKCEIRRFQDGSILETVVWPGETAEDRKSVTQNICAYILCHRHNIKKITFSGELCDRFLQLPKCHFGQRYGTGDEQLVDINMKFNELAKVLRKLSDLPADITTVHGLSEELCYTAVFPQVATTCDTDARSITRLEGRCVPRPENHGFPKLVQPIDILLTVECSKWPDDLNALQHSKTAFYIALAKGMEGRQCQVFHNHVLVLFHGLVFRVRVFCAKEIPLTKQIISPEGMVKHVENKMSNQLEFECSILPKLVSALHGLHMQHSTFGAACRLAKRWLASHLLSDAFPWVAVDLLVAFCYIQPLPLSLPHSSRAGFQRFLNLLANFDWRLNPLIVNFNGQLTSEEIQQRNSFFTRNRPSLPAMFICTPYDKKNTSWITADNPIGPSLQRAVVLAKRSLAFIETQMSEGQNVFGAFRTTLDVYDFVIKLDPRVMVTNHFGMNPDIEKLSFTKIRDEIPVVDFDPVKMFLDDLKTAYGHLCIFFYDKYGGTNIGGLWIPKAQAPVPFKVHNLIGRKLTEPAKVLTPNYSAILSDLRVLGQGLVKDIVEQRCPTTFSRFRKDSR